MSDPSDPYDDRVAQTFPHLSEEMCVRVASFVMIGAEPNTDWLNDCVELDAKRFVVTGSHRWAIHRYLVPADFPTPARPESRS